MIRLILTALFMICFFIVSLVLYLLVLFIGLFNKNARAKLSQFFAVGALKGMTFFSGANVVTKGLENVPKDTPVLYVANHRSYYDIVIGYTLVKNNTGFIAKKEMTKFPFVNWWMYLMNCQFLDRENIKEGLKTILKCIDYVKTNKTSFFIFPEGTRTSGDEMSPFKEGSFKIAEKSGCPIIPVAISNTEEVFENHVPKIKKTTVVFNFLDPIYPDQLEKEQKRHLGSHVQQLIADQLVENHQYF